LDDNAEYISLIDDSDRDLTDWRLSNSSVTVVEVLDEPFPESPVSKVTAENTTGSTGEFSAVSNDVAVLTQLNQDLGTFSVSAFLHPNTEFISGFYIGYEYYDTVSGENIQKLKYFSNEIYNAWIFVSETFNILNQNTAIRLVVKAEFVGGDQNADYSFLVNGFSLGQWSEEFNSTSLGSEKIEIPFSLTGLSGKFGIEALPYGLSDKIGYYLAKSNSLVAKNTGMPLVYGTNSATTLYPNDSDPSLILPGMGFLNESGKFKEYTFEAWIRISSDAVENKKIMGSLHSEDGLYVMGPFINLIVSGKRITHYVGKWYRPMLLNITYSPTSIGMMINGEQVGEISIDATKMTLAPANKVIDDTTVDSDWLGFWAYEDVSPIEIDAVAMYGYRVSPQVAKRRFVYGQGVEFPENINNAYSGSSVFIDYPFANYSKNYSYPNIGRWSQGVYDNVDISSRALSVPQYQKPSVFLSNKTETQWLDDLEASQLPGENFLSFRPNPSWDDTEAYLLLNGFSLENETAKAIYLICEELSPSDSNQTLLLLQDDVTQDSFEIRITPNSIDYLLSSNGIETVVESKQKLYLGERFPVGVNFQKFSDYYGGEAAQFFGRLASMSIYVGGSKSLINTFTGKLHSVGISSSRNLSQISSLFYIDGTMFSEIFLDGNNLDMVLDAGEDTSSSAVFSYVYDGGTLGSFAQNALNYHEASYAISVGESMTGFSMNMSCNSLWEDYIPLSYFAKNVNDSRGDSRLDLDFIQFNINFPAPSIFTKTVTPGSWTYEELKSEYSNPIQRNYDSLDNYLFTGFGDYEDLKNRAQNTYTYDTESSIVRTYVTFQILADGANKSLDLYNSIVPASKDGIVSPGEEWLSSAYEVVDNMIIYPPQSFDFQDLAIVTHVVFNVSNIEESPVQIKSLEYASLSLSDSEPTPIGTRFGNDIYPYRKDGFYFNYKERNPFSIYKSSTPYLYLTRDSGVTLRGGNDPNINRGIEFPINQSASDDYKVIAMQTSLRFDQDFFPYAPMKIFELQSKNSYINFYLVATHPSGKRGKIYAINSRGQLENGIAFFLNGKLVKEPTITVKEWAMLGVRFANTLDFGSYIGAFRLTAPFTINNFSHYKSTNLQEVQTVLERSWFKVFSSGSLTLDWEYWNTIPYLWQEVLVISNTSYYGVDPSDIYKIYTGTNKIIVDDGVETNFGDYGYKVYRDASWQSQTIEAV
jgi:hypothetical protein